MTDYYCPQFLRSLQVKVKRRGDDTKYVAKVLLL